MLHKLDPNLSLDNVSRGLPFWVSLPVGYKDVCFLGMELFLQNIKSHTSGLRGVPYIDMVDITR